MATKIPAPKKSREAPPPLEQAPQNLEKPPPFETETLNFKMTVEFKREFKTYAVSRGMTMTELLRECYQLYRQHNGS